MSKLVGIRKADIDLAQAFHSADYTTEMYAAAEYETSVELYYDEAVYATLCKRFVPVGPDNIERARWFNYFDWIPVVNLTRRPERWDKFLERYQAVKNWPFRAPDRFDAVDGKAVGCPTWLKSGAPAWGCAQSHLQIVQTAIQRGYNRVLVLEDDALFCSDFSRLAKQYISELPADWHQAYFGGQHLRQKIRAPHPISLHVVRAYNVNRTHGYAIQQPFFRPLYQWMVDYVAWSKSPQHHVDHHMGRLHETGKYNIFTPKEFLVGQAEGFSDITCQEHPMRFWGATAKEILTGKNMPPFIAVVGIHRSGSSMLAWILKHLGVHMGNKVNGNCEAAGLQQLCERLYPFGATTPAAPPGAVAEMLKAFVRDRTAEAAHQNTAVGGKYPHLCAMRDMLIEACKWGLKVIHIDRPLEDSIASLVTRVGEDRKRGIKWLGISDEKARSVQHWLNAEKQRYFDGKIPAANILHVNYYDVLKDPKPQIERIVAFLGLTPTPEQWAAALGAVQPKKRRHVNGTFVGPGKS